MAPVGNINNKSMSIKAYRKAKMKILEHEFCIQLNEDEKAHFETLHTESVIDRYARTILQNRWD
jgi:hypothetical protein